MKISAKHFGLEVGP